MNLIIQSSGKKSRASEFIEINDDEDVNAPEYDVAKHGLLPSIMDSKIWKIKCKLGFERQLVMQIMRKAIDYLNKEKPFLIMTVFHCDKSDGNIFIEAHKLSHVKSIVNGMSNIYKRGIEMIAIKDMT
jgi:transcription elongation factor SPT5